MKALRALSLCIGVAAALALGVVPAFGQTGTATVSGAVTDTQGGIIPGATVTITSLATGTARTTVTNESGLYQFPSVPPAVYRLTVELSGFRTALVERLELQVDTARRVDIRLEIGELAETVTVTERSPVVGTIDASLGNVISGTQIQQLPMEGRNVVGLLSLQPGAVFLPTNTDLDPRTGSVSGARSDQSNVTLDGVDVNDPQFGSAYTSVLRMTLDAVQEFRVTTSNYSADQGRSSAAQVSLVTRSGTNEFHGSSYWYHRNTATSSNEYFLKLSQLAGGDPSEPPKLNKHIAGGALGGPIRRDKFFFFGNFEGLQESSESPATRAIPSNSYRDGVLMYRCADPGACPGGSVTGFSETHAVPAGFYGLSPAELAAIDPLGIGPNQAASAYWKQYPQPNAQGRDGINIMEHRFAAPIKNDFLTYITRLDYQATSNQRLFFRGNYQDDTVNSTPQFPGQDPNRQVLTDSRGFAVGYDTILSPTLTNTFRYGYTQISEQTAGLRRSNFVTFRFIDSLEFDPFDSSTSGRSVPTHNFVNDLTWLRGSHTVRLGANIRRTRNNRFNDAGSFHTGTANGSWVSGVGRAHMPGDPRCMTPGCAAVPAVAPGFAASYSDGLIPILGIISQASARYNYDRDGNPLPVGEPVRRIYGSDEYEAYIQDTWQLTRNFTLSAGLRYSLYSPPFEVNGLQVAPTIGLGEWFQQRGENAAQGIPANAQPSLEIDLAGPVNNRRGFYDWDYNNIAPRASFAWTPQAESGLLGWITGQNRMVIRGGYSKAFDRIGQALATTFDNFGSFGLSTSLTSPFGVNNEDNPDIRFVDLNTLPPHLPAAPPGGFPQTPPLGAGVITTSIDSTITTPSAHMLSFVVGRELSPNYSIEAAYVGRFGRDLLVRRDLAAASNLVDPASGMDYFTAAQQLIRATQAAGGDWTQVGSVPYFENIFPGAAGGGLTATQAVARRYTLDSPDYITSLWLMDQFCFPACSKFGPFAFFSEQYDSLSGQSSIGRSDYNALQVSLRKRWSDGYQFDVNYTLARSKDMGSGFERGGSFGSFFSGGYTDFIINAWDPDLQYSFSDFDMRHQLNLNGVFDLPVGRERRFGSGMPGWLNGIVGDWQVAGLMRLTSGLPFNVINCRGCWATNWNLQGNAELVDPNRLPPTASPANRDAVGGQPSPFVNPQDALTFFRRQLPGEVGIRNRLRGDGYFVVDLGVSKAWSLPYAQGHRLRFRWETFNLTNTVRFNTGQVTMLPDITDSFGRYDGTLSTCDGRAGRCMQFALRYEF